MDARIIPECFLLGCPCFQPDPPDSAQVFQTRKMRGPFGVKAECNQHGARHIITVGAGCISLLLCTPVNAAVVLMPGCGTIICGAVAAMAFAILFVIAKIAVQATYADAQHILLMHTYFFLRTIYLTRARLHLCHNDRIGSWISQHIYVCIFIMKEL